MMKRLIPVFVLLAACGEAVDQPQKLPEQVVDVRGVQVKAQIADEYEEHSIGLMFVKSMPKNNGMLFVWPEAQERSFWMKNTFIPLDLLYAHNGKIVSIVEGAKPHDETGLPSGKPADMVLEVNAGWVKTHGIKVGDPIVVKP